MTAPEKLQDFLAELGRRVDGDLRADDMSRALYSSDAGLYQIMPHAVLIPRTAADVQAAVTLAAAYGVPLLPRTAGTSLAGQSVNEALVIDFTRHLDAILEIVPEERRVRLQPGVVLDELNLTLRRHGLQFGPDPASSSRACLGGVVANNATGSHSIVYGMTADHVLGMEVILSDGGRARFGPGGATGDPAAARIATGLAALLADPVNQQAIRDGTPVHWRRAGGYNLDRLLPADDAPAAPNPAQLICGSEGTLAVMTEIELNLVPAPTHTALALLHFDDLRAALTAVPALLELRPSAVELLDDLSLVACRDMGGEYARLLASVVDGRPFCLLIVEFQGDSEAEARGGYERLERLLGHDRLGSTGLTPALTPAQQSAVWQVRKVGLGLLMSMPGRRKPVPFIEDAAVPVEHLPDYVNMLEDFCRELGVPITYYAHASAGCLHIRPLLDLDDAADVALMPTIARRSAELVRGFGGALSSEHGDGRARSWLNPYFFGPALYGLYCEVKRLFDPDGLLNPGVVVEAGPMTDHLRPATGATAPVAPGPAHLDFSDYLPEKTGRPGEGFARAVALCNGAGVCRQKIGGTMCPSFMVTRDETHSTRGRANALRAAMTGLLPVEELTGERMYDVMDLCVGCKACKAECPSAVDMARLKTEFLAQYYAVHGVPLRARFFGHVAALNRLGSGRLAPLSNALLSSRAGRAGLNRLLGLAPERPLPSPAREPFMAWFGRRKAEPAPAGEPVGTLLLLVDPFTNFNQPEVGAAAARLFAAAGWAVRAVELDDARPFLSNGLVDEARRTADRALARLAPPAEAGLPLVGLEPSSLLTLRDEFRYLLPGDPRVPLAAAGALTFEEFVAGAAERGQFDITWQTEPRRVLLHGHCHQKALVGTGPARRALSLPPGYVVEEVDSGCCGMAGSFGYEAEHLALSLQMAERRLLPAVRAADPETLIVAAGVSCRAQIAYGSGRAALHPAEVLWGAAQPQEAGRP